MNNIPDNVLRIFGGPIPSEPIREINPMLLIAGAGILVVAVLIISNKLEEKQH